MWGLKESHSLCGWADNGNIVQMAIQLPVCFSDSQGHLIIQDGGHQNDLPKIIPLIEMPWLDWLVISVVNYMFSVILDLIFIRGMTCIFFFHVYCYMTTSGAFFRYLVAARSVWLGGSDLVNRWWCMGCRGLATVVVPWFQQSATSSG